MKCMSRELSQLQVPVVIVKKKDSGMRFRVDYRKLNDVTHRFLPSNPGGIGGSLLGTLNQDIGRWRWMMRTTAFSIGSSL